MAIDYRVRVKRIMRVTQNSTSFDGYSTPQVTRTQARVEIVMPRCTLVFNDPPSMQTFINACAEAHDEAFTAPPGQASNTSPIKHVHADADQAAWRRFYAQLIDM
ncbi:hypothetical protein [Paraburkholderia hayleyella]|uniref:hypothetical protein n=1 Tax=Paraburkholderia hayleyella TaxID=2152889 RepID=UPI001291DE9A|nr:hypothetical protein [Paraburkholderia hayleyella]